MKTQSENPNEPARETRGFTLIEVMVAISIFSLIMIGALACWKCITNGTNIGLQAAAAAQRTRVSIRTIEAALTTAEMSTFQGNLQYYSFVTDTSGKFASLELTSRLPDNFPGSGLFGDIVLRRVAFEVQRGQDNEMNLVMTQWPILMQTSDQYPPYPITLARDVTAFNIEFWSQQENDFLTEFAATNDLPFMVRVTLGVGHSARDPSLPYEVITRTIALPSRPH